MSKTLLYTHARGVTGAVCLLWQQFLLGRSVPVLVVGCKAEAAAVTQEHEQQPTAFCHKHKLPPPQLFTCVESINSDIYVKLATMAQYP